MDIRIGVGYDIHKLIRNKTFILGNVIIPYKKGFLAHSDGDVLIHSIIDSILGALNLGDIGRLFPDTDKAYKEINSKILLEKIMCLLIEKEYEIINIDNNIICQKPKLADYIPEMKKKLSEIMKISEDKISIKAKTKEKLDAIGKCRGVEVHSVCLLKKVNH